MKISSIKYHLNNGTFIKAARNKIARQFGAVQEPEITRWNIVTEAEAIGFLVKRSSQIAASHPGKKLVLIVEPGANRDVFLSKFGAQNIVPEVLEAEHLSRLEIENTASVACIVCGYFNAAGTMACGRFLIAHENTREIPFEYILIPQIDFERPRKFDLYQTYSFTSPLFADRIDYISIYEASLKRFEQKCDIRDYMDLCQALRHIVKNKIKGDIAEFGSFRGHSGYLITETLRQLGEEKRILLFDMFAEFPPEGLGVDYFWDEHKVNYEEVRNKFSGFKNVELVKGDFTETILNFPETRFSFVYMDCDSYRATKFLVDHLFDKQLNVGGMIVFEDYGHPALLGNRLAVHECFDNRQNCFTFYSQFSGYYIVVKTADN